MSVQRVKEFLQKFDKQNDIIVMETSTATVDLAAAALGTEPKKIAKTIALKGAGEGNYIIVVAAGDAKVDNHKFKDEFLVKPKMLSADETLAVTGYAVGGVCPFDINVSDSVTLVLDDSLKRFEHVYPACGNANSAIKLTISELSELTNNPRWVNVCKGWED